MAPGGVWGGAPRGWGADGVRFGSIMGPLFPPGLPPASSASQQLQMTCSVFSPNLAPPSQFPAEVFPRPPEISAVNAVFIVLLPQTVLCPAQPYWLHYA